MEEGKERETEKEEELMGEKQALFLHCIQRSVVLWRQQWQGRQFQPLSWGDGLCGNTQSLRWGDVGS